MAKLFFRYGAMGSSKTANALMVRYNYLEKGQRVLMLKPRSENRDGAKIIRSRIGLQAECTFVEDFLSHIQTNWQRPSNPSPDDWHGYAAIIVDEAQFLTTEQVDKLSDVVDEFDIPVLCYGLRTDFQNHLFSGSLRLMEIADVIEQIPTVCWCGKRAHCNTRFSNGKIVRDGVQVMLGGSESYVALCRKHYKQGLLFGAVSPAQSTEEISAHPKNKPLTKG